MSNKQNNQSQNLKPGPQSNSKRPDERSHLDSRANEEQDFKGDDTTHNKKETEKGKLKKK
ncbi:MAG TPA: hypothetical protein VN726_11375 [Hanamia sp.]|jgi:hypothetical protein|nr:hypothetical protein [Hanamia sp.]